jgi:hypothetical protein
MTLQYVMRIQGSKKIKGGSMFVTIPHNIVDILSLEVGTNVSLELAVDNSKGKSEKVCVIRRLQSDEIDTNSKPRVNVIT